MCPVRRVGLVPCHEQNDEAPDDGADLANYKHCANVSPVASVVFFDMYSCRNLTPRLIPINMREEHFCQFDSPHNYVCGYEVLRLVDGAVRKPCLRCRSDRAKRDLVGRRVSVGRSSTGGQQTPSSVLRLTDTTTTGTDRRRHVSTGTSLSFGDSA